MGWQACQQRENGAAGVAGLNEQRVAVQFRQFHEGGFVFNREHLRGGAVDGGGLMKVGFGNGEGGMEQSEIECAAGQFHSQRTTHEHAARLFQQAEFFERLNAASRDLAQGGFEARAQLFQFLRVAADYAAGETEQRFTLPVEHTWNDGEQFAIRRQIVASEGRDGTAIECVLSQLQAPGRPSAFPAG